MILCEINRITRHGLSVVVSVSTLQPHLSCFVPFEKNALPETTPNDVENQLRAWSRALKKLSLSMAYVGPCKGGTPHRLFCFQLEHSDQEGKLGSSRLEGIASFRFVIKYNIFGKTLLCYFILIMRNSKIRANLNASPQ